MISRVISFFLLILFSSVGFAESYQLRIIHGDNMNSNNGRALLKLKELIDAKFPGKFNTVITNNSKVSNSGGDLDAINVGLADLALVNIDNIISQSKSSDFMVLQLPYLYVSNKEFKKLIESKLNDEILSSLRFGDRKNIQAIALWPGEKKYWFSKKNIEDIKQLEAKKIVTRNTEPSLRFVKTMGAEPIGLSYSDNPSKYNYAYESGDIIEDTAENILRNKNIFNANTIIDTSHLRDVAVVVVNKNWLSSIPESSRALFIETIKDIGYSNIDIFDKNEIKELESIKSNYSMKTYTPDKWEQAEFFQAGQMVQKYYSKNNNKQLLEKSKLTLTNQYR